MDPSQINIDIIRMLLAERAAQDAGNEDDMEVLRMLQGSGMGLDAMTNRGGE